MIINNQNVALENINEFAQSPVEGVNSEIRSKSDLYDKLGLDFEVEAVNLSDLTGDDKFGRFYGIKNTRSGDIYSIVGKKYTPIQNSELIDAFDEVRQMYGGEYSAAGVMRGGSRIWVQATLPKKYTFNMPGRDGDEINSMITMLIGHDGIVSNVIYPNSKRGFCNNQFVSLLQESTRDLRIQHFSNYEKKIDMVRGLFHKNMDKLSSMYKSFSDLDSQVISKEELTTFLNKLYPVKNEEDDRTMNIHSDITALFKNGAGNLGRTRWDAFNAVTEYVDHHQNTTRLANAIERGNHEYVQNRIGSMNVPGGQLDRMKRRALNILRTSKLEPAVFNAN